MKILITNDDGYQAPGIQCLFHHLAKSHDVIMVAPAENKSACGSAITVRAPIKLVDEGENFFALAGSPADCVLVAIGGFLDQRFPGWVPDVVVSGINAGANLGDDVRYSGTVAGALEARYLDFPALAVSLVSAADDYSTFVHFDTAAQVVDDVLSNINQWRTLDDVAVLNINVPDLPYEKLENSVFTRVGQRAKPQGIVEVNGEFLLGPVAKPRDDVEGTDFYAISQNQVSISPLLKDVTAHQQLAAMKQNKQSEQ